MRGYNDGVNKIVARLNQAVKDISYDDDLSEYGKGQIQGAMEDAITTIETMYSDMESVLSDWQ